MSYGFQIFNSTGQVIFDPTKPGAWNLYAGGSILVSGGTFSSPSITNITVSGVLNSTSFFAVLVPRGDPGYIQSGVYQCPDGGSFTNGYMSIELLANTVRIKNRQGNSITARWLVFKRG